MSIRKQLEAGILKGHTVTFRGQFYNQIGDLPSEAELAKGDKAQEDAARINIKNELARLASQLELLNKTDEPEAPKTPEKAEPKAAKKEADEDKKDEK